MSKNFGPQLVLNTELAKAQATVKKTIDDAFVDGKKKWYEYIFFSWTYLFISWFLVIYFIGVPMLYLRKNLWKKRAKRALPIDEAETYKRILEGSYSNIKVSSVSNGTINRALLESYRGTGIPNEAWIIKVIPSPLITVDGSTFIINKVTWKWTNGKQTYIVPKTYTQVMPTGKRFNDLTFGLAKRSKLSFNKGKDMDNDEFNKRFSFKHNNAVKFRMLFTVGAQEKYVKMSRTKLGRIFEMDKLQNTMLLSHSIIGSPFEPNAKRVTLNNQKLKEMLVNDLKNDVSVVFRIMILVASLNGLIEK